MKIQNLVACLAALRRKPGSYHVYVLHRPNGAPFYVGCGKVKRRGLQRIAFHEREARTTVVSHKCNLIRSIQRSGNTIGYAIESWHETGLEMFAREVALIAKIGRSDQGRGPLTNWSDGGDGLVNRAEAVRVKASLTMNGLVDDEWRRRSSERVKAHWKSADGRAKRLAANARAETKARQSAAAKATAASPSNEKRKATMRKIWKSAAYRKRQKIAHIAALRSKEYKAKKSTEATARWADPAYRERLRQVHLRRWAAKRESAVLWRKRHKPNGGGCPDTGGR